MNDKLIRDVFFISDSTGITAETLGQSLISQFEQVTFNCVTLPYIDTQEKALDALQEINKSENQKQIKPIIFTTLVDKSIRDIFASGPGKVIDLFETFLVPLEEELKSKSSYTIGGSRPVTGRVYKTRINAVNFALNNDDGHSLHQYPQADLILVGVSRCGKTPTCLYMALQFGVLVANYPLTEEILDTDQLPNHLKPFKKKLVGLTIDPLRLSSIRQERVPNTRYSSIDQCHHELNQALNIMKKENIPILDTTELSIEEISTKILMITGVKRQVWKK